MTISLTGWGQSRKELESKRLEIIKNIEKTNKSLESTKKLKVENVEKLKLLDQQIVQRQQLIQTLKNEVSIQDRKLQGNMSALDSLGNKQHTLVTQYSQMLRMSYLKKMSNSKWSYLLSSRNLNNLLLRWIYLRQKKAYTKNKLQSISNITTSIKSSHKEIKKLQEEKKKLVKQPEDNMKVLG